MKNVLYNIPRTRKLIFIYFLLFFFADLSRETLSYKFIWKTNPNPIWGYYSIGFYSIVWPDGNTNIVSFSFISTILPQGGITQRERESERAKTTR